MIDDDEVLGRGDDVALRRRDGAVELVVGGVFAMDSREVASELALARELGERPGRVLVGGLGLGYTAAELLRLGAAEVTVVELSAELIGWAREARTEQLGAVAADPRVRLVHADLADALAGSVPQVAGPYDAVLLDVDNGPSFLIHPHNEALYEPERLRQALDLLAPGGTLGVWCEERSPALVAALTALGPTREVIVPVEREGRRFDYALTFTVRG